MSFSIHCETIVCVSPPFLIMTQEHNKLQTVSRTNVMKQESYNRQNQFHLQSGMFKAAKRIVHKNRRFCPMMGKQRLLLGLDALVLRVRKICLGE